MEQSSVKRNIRVIINPLYVLFLFLPLFILLNFIFKEYTFAFLPPVRIDNGNYVVCTAYSCNRYDINIIDNPKLHTQPNQSFVNKFEIDKQLAEESHRQSQSAFYFLVLLAMFPLILLFFTLTKNSITLKNNVITIRSFIFFLRPIYSIGKLVIPGTTWKWQTTRHAVIPIDRITKILVTTTTPLADDKHIVNEINWRDRVTFNYTTADGLEREATVELFIFPAFKKIIAEIVTRYPKVPIAFGKVTIAQNVNTMSV